MQTQFSPLARTNDLIVQPLDDEIVLYDTRTEQAHVLNKTSAAVWKLADGRRTVPQLTQLVSRELHAEPDADLVRLALAQLSKAGLLEQPAALPFAAALTRREFLQKAAVAAMVIPVVKTISAPGPQNGVSCGDQGSFCITSKDCCGFCECFLAQCECCFVAGTLVLFADGTRRPIETVKVGDFVLGRDELSGVVAPQRVEKSYVHYEREAFTLDFGTSALGTTAVHPFYTDRGWVRASELRGGMDCHLDDGSRLTIQNVMHPLALRQTVYNLEVANFHTYFVGEQGVWVHNKA